MSGKSSTSGPSEKRRNAIQNQSNKVRKWSKALCGQPGQVAENLLTVLGPFLGPVCRFPEGPNLQGRIPRPFVQHLSSSFPGRGKSAKRVFGCVRRLPQRVRCLMVWRRNTRPGLGRARSKLDKCQGAWFTGGTSFAKFGPEWAEKVAKIPNDFWPPTWLRLHLRPLRTVRDARLNMPLGPLRTNFGQSRSTLEPNSAKAGTWASTPLLCAVPRTPVGSPPRLRKHAVLSLAAEP